MRSKKFLISYFSLLISHFSFLISMDSLIGQQLANFRIERPLGRGGMAQVYYGQDVKLDRPVAIKLIDARHRQNPSYAERFVREAQAVAKWHHEHIVQIYYADDQDGLYYFVMEFVDGQDLEGILAEYRAKNELMPHNQVLHVAEALAEALDYAHEQGVIHRDVKPANLMVAKDGRVILMDFGLAMDVEQGSIGEVFGSTKYIAPEQARRSSDALPQSDIYALGVMLYEILTDHLPFDDPSPTALAIQHLTMEPPRPREFNPKLNAETEAVLLKALQKSPDQRYQTGAELIAALKAALAGDTELLPTKVAAAPPIFNPDNLMGQLLDEYRLEKLLGQGGMARVYLGVDVNLDRRVAIKVIDTPYRDDETYEMRFQREAKAIAQLEHPQIVRLYRYGKANGLLYMAMQFIEGQTLQAQLAHYRDQGDYMPFAEVQRIITKVCAALDYAHSKSVIHRDIKPSNIMLNEQEEVFLADFGLALLQDVGTRGEVLGTPHYIAPEQAMSSAGVVTQSDLYAVGVILFYMLTNSLPFDAADPLDIAMLHMSEPPPAPRTIRPDLSPELEGVMLKTLAKKPTERYATGAELVAALEQALPQAESAVPVAPPPPAPVVEIQPEPIAPPVAVATPTQPEPAKPTRPAVPTLPPIPAVMAARQNNQPTTKTPSILTKIAETSPANRSILSVTGLKERGGLPYIVAAIVILLLLCGAAYLMFGTGQKVEIVQTTPTLSPTSTVAVTEVAAAFDSPTATVAVVATMTMTPTEVAATATLTPTEIAATPTEAVADDQNKLTYLALWRSTFTSTITARGEKWFSFNSKEATNGAIIAFVRNRDWLDMVVYDGSQIGRWPPSKPDSISNVGLGTDRDLDGNQYTKEFIWEGNFVPNTTIYIRLINRLNKTVEYCVATRNDAKHCP